jgi:hypothetical protein
VWPNASIDGVEIDPLVSEVGVRYLGMENPKLTVHTADARVWVRSTDERFDGMVIDAYRQPYIPFHLVSREFFQQVRGRLTAGGVVAINVGTPPGQTDAVDMIAATMRDVFPSVVQVRVDEFNSVIVGERRGLDDATRRARLASVPPLIASVAASFGAELRPVVPGGTILTDDHAPIEWVTDGAIVAYLQQGAPEAGRDP